MVRGRYDPEQKEFVSQWIVPEEREYQRMTGAGRCFGDVMFAHGLRAPLIQKPRARFYPYFPFPSDLRHLVVLSLLIFCIKGRLELIHESAIISLIGICQ